MANNRTNHITPRYLAMIAKPDRLELIAHLIANKTAPPGMNEETTKLLMKQLSDAGILVNSEIQAKNLAEKFNACLNEVRQMLVEDHTPETAKHLTKLPFRNGRLIDIPSNPKLRRELLEWIVSSVLKKSEYSEAQINETLLGVHDDYAALRRYMVDDGFLSRDPHAGKYFVE